VDLVIILIKPVYIIALFGVEIFKLVLLDMDFLIYFLRPKLINAALCRYIVVDTSVSRQNRVN
jgi:uncharacterized membrane protein